MIARRRLLFDLLILALLAPGYALLVFGVTS